MNRSRQMPNSTEQQSSSDDLIAELARLMAEEAQGDRPAAQPPAPTAPTPAASATGQGQKLPEGGNVVRIPGARPLSAPSAPAGSVWGRAQDTPAPANSDQRADTDHDAPEPLVRDTSSTEETIKPETPKAGVTGSAQVDDDTFFMALNTPAVVEDDLLVPHVPEPTDAPDLSEWDTRASRASAEPENADAPFDDPIATLIAEQEREDAERAARAPRPKPIDTAVPAEHSAPVVKVRPTPVLRREGHPFVPEKTSSAEAAPHQQTTSGSSVEDDVLSLLRTMSESRQGQSARNPAKGEDRFEASPLTRSKPTPTPRSSDPLDEIESLIGDAVRLSRDDRPPSSAATASAASLDDAAYAAEAAIAAAAAETARPSRPTHRSEAVATPAMAALDVGMTADAASTPQQVKPMNNRLIVGGAAAATILVAVGLGLFWMFGSGGEMSGAVPVLSSNTTDAKETVEQNTTTAEVSQPAMFNELDGKTDDTPTDEQIVSRDQSTDMATDVRQVATPETADESLANRKVRTVTVRPDGTIVSTEDSVAANEVLPVDRPNVPTLSGDTGTTEDFQVTTAPIATDTPVTDAATTETLAATGADPLAGLVSDAVAEATTPSGDVIADAPYPAERPADAAFVVASVPEATVARTTANTNGNTIDLIAGVANQVASQLPTTTVAAPQANTAAPPPSNTATATAPVATTTTTSAAPAGPDAPAYVQLSSQRSEEAATATLASITQRYKGLFNGAEPIVRQVDLGDRGIYYRVLVPANSLNDAAGVCASVKSAGGDCFVRNN